MLLERNMLDLVGEAIVLRHPGAFARATVDSARRRLDRYSDSEALLWPCGRDYVCAGEAVVAD